ncbi:unnamed protein product [Peronospora belbahrii]|uniref:Uncharacterized protein n=1 Tax=Peronospora belbahrii TaxID=622444 RepID=A0ABN8D523_9STRA|nr:unnamed protein product [Peronospora belbahrii]
MEKRNVEVGEVVKQVSKNFDSSRWYFDTGGRFGTIILAVMVDEQMTFVLVEDDVLYVPSPGCNLFSPGLALNQGFQLSWKPNKRMFWMTKGNMEVIRTTHERHLWTFTAHNIGCSISKNTKITTKKQICANFAITDGVEDIKECKFVQISQLQTVSRTSKSGMSD